MKIDATRDGGAVDPAPRGATRPRVGGAPLQHAGRAAPRRGPVADASTSPHVTYVSSAATKVLARWQQELALLRGEVQLTALPPAVRDMFAVTGWDASLKANRRLVRAETCANRPGISDRLRHERPVPDVLQRTGGHADVPPARSSRSARPDSVSIRRLRSRRFPPTSVRPRSRRDRRRATRRVRASRRAARGRRLHRVLPERRRPLAGLPRGRRTRRAAGRAGLRAHAARAASPSWCGSTRSPRRTRFRCPSWRRCVSMPPGGKVCRPGDRGRDGRALSGARLSSHRPRRAPATPVRCARRARLALVRAGAHLSR